MRYTNKTHANQLIGENAAYIVDNNARMLKHARLAATHSKQWIIGGLL
jgi:hypothetical protein